MTATDFLGLFALLVIGMGVVGCIAAWFAERKDRSK